MSSELSPDPAPAGEPASSGGVTGDPHTWNRTARDRSVPGDGLTAGQGHTFGAALAQLTSTIKSAGAGGDEHAVAVIMQQAVAMIPGAEQAAVVIPVHSRQLHAQAVYGELPPLIIGVQNATGEGPCLQAVGGTSQVLVADLRTDARWPRFAAEATRLGVRSMLCTPLAARDRILGSLSLASAEPNAFDSTSIAMATVFAAHATFALLGVQEVRALTVMAHTRDLIGQAKGILMERHKLSSDAAFDLLVTVSQHTNVKVRQVCEWLLSTGELPVADPAAQPKQ